MTFMRNAGAVPAPGGQVGLAGGRAGPDAAALRSAGPADAGQPGVPRIKIVRGMPTAEETATVIAVIMARASAGPMMAEPGQPAGRPAGSAWSDRSRLLRRPLAPGPGAWRASALPA